MVASNHSRITPIATASFIEEKRYLRVGDASTYSGLSTSEVYRAIYSGELRALRFKVRSWLITREDLDDWIERNSTPNVA